MVKFHKESTEKYVNYRTVSNLIQVKFEPNFILVTKMTVREPHLEVSSFIIQSGPHAVGKSTKFGFMKKEKSIYKALPGGIGTVETEIMHPVSSYL